MSITNDIKKIISNKKELDFCDFKQQYYLSTKSGSLIKDVVSLANNILLDNKYLLFGVGDDGKILGIDVSKLPDISSINQLLNENVEPFIDVNWEVLKNINDTGLDIAALVIKKSNTDYPYLIRKDYSRNGINLSKGTIFLRKGATNMVANRVDLDNIYANKNTLNINIIDGMVRIKKIKNGNKEENVLVLNTLISNYSENDKTIESAKIILHVAGSVLECEIKYIEDDRNCFSKTLKHIAEKKRIVVRESQQLCTFYAESSEGLVNLIKMSDKNVNCILKITSECGRKYVVQKNMIMEVGK